MLKYILISFITFCAVEISSAQIAAFPGAEGFGSTTPGGRRGRVIEVTNLNPDGVGSFRAACEAEGPRIIVFHTGGTITLTRNIVIRNPYLTIAGQTAPGDGICIRGAGMTITTHDVIIRGLRIRVGDDPNGPDPDNRDGIQIENGENVAGAHNIIIDHCSISWAIDENVASWYESHDVTFQWNIISEALRNSTHPKGEHSMGMLIGPGSKRISIHHNLFAHNKDRNPLMGGGSNSQFGGPTECEIINNVIYNYYWGSTRFTKNLTPDASNLLSYNHIIGNYYKKSENTEFDYGIMIREEDNVQDTRIFVKSNIGLTRKDDYQDEWDIVNGSVVFRANNPLFPTSGIVDDSPFDAYKMVLKSAGAIAPYRDPVDLRIIQSVNESTGTYIDSQFEIGGWPTLISGTPPIDSDHDGIPNNWEMAHGLNPQDPNDGKNDTDGDGYTNVEEYINELVPVGFEKNINAPQNLRVD